MNKSSIFVTAAALALAAGALFAQQTAPAIQFDSNPSPVVLPDNIHLGEVAGVATNSKGDIYIYTRTGNPSISIGTSRAVAHGGSRLFQFDKSGKFVREIGQGAYGLLEAQQVRVDPSDNIWIVDQMSTQVIKFDPNGRIQMILSRKPEAVNVPNPRLDPLPAGVPVIQPAAQAGRGGGGEDGGGGGRGAGRGGPPALPGAGPTGETFNRPTDVAWDAQGNIYVTDGFGNSRVAKYDRNGKWIRNWGSRGNGEGQFNMIHGIAIDAQGNVYVADEGNKRIQVFDGDGNFKTQFTNVGSPTAICITRGPQQVLFVAHTGDPDGMEDAAIYKLDLKGTVLGKFGSAGKQPKEFGLVNAIDCRNETDLLVGELSNWRVQRLTLRASR